MTNEGGVVAFEDCFPGTKPDLSRSQLPFRKGNFPIEIAGRNPTKKTLVSAQEGSFLKRTLVFRKLGFHFAKRNFVLREPRRAFHELSRAFRELSRAFHEPSPPSVAGSLAFR